MYGVLIGKTVRQERRIVNWRNAPVLPENFAMTVRISLYTNVLSTCAWKCLLSDWIRTAKKGAWPSWRKCLCTVPQDRRLHRRMDQPNMCKCPGTATYPTLHAGEQWISRVAPIETWESLPPMKLHNVKPELRVQVPISCYQNLDTDHLKRKERETFWHVLNCSNGT